jgi:signal transduction histidine kinase/DNA-binding response OmpR family regulator
MQNEPIFSALSDILTCSALFMLAVYHSMIYWGRRKETEEIYNLYFSIFILSATGFIVAPYCQPEHLLYNYKPTWLTVPNMEAFAVWCLFFSGTKFLNVLLKVPSAWTRYFRITYATVAISFLLTLIGNFVSLAFYFKYFLPFVLLIVALNVFLIYAVYGYWVYQQKLLRQNFYKIVYIGFVALTLNLFIYRTIELLTMPSVLILNHFITAVILYIFAYALSVKFNTEYFELKALKITLEKKVEERTDALTKSNQLLEQQNVEIEKQKQEIVEANKLLLLRAEELYELNQTRSKFFTGISHEFRTPLTLIIGPLEALLSKSVDDSIKGEYKLMLRQAKRLLAFINQLLELSKLEKGVHTLVPVIDNFNQFIRTIISSYGSFADELNVQLNFVDECNELIIRFDKDKVEKIITNLVTNALKFTNNGGRVDVILSISDDAKSVQLTVSDNGIGIEPEHLDRIFEPFYQIDSMLSNRIEGTGIGLSLVKELVELHRGAIDVKSSVQEGTCFVVQLPIDRSLSSEEKFADYEMPAIEFQPAAAAVIDARNGMTGIHKNILLVEDNVDMRAFIKSSLPNEFQIEEAINGKEGIEKANELMPDLIITDVMMPVMNGINMTHIIKQDERTSHIPIIMLTAKVSMESKLEGLRMEADDYITKPFNVDELTLRIYNLLSMREKLRDKFTKCITVNPTELVTTSVDERFLQRALQLVEENLNESEFTSAQFCDELLMSRAHVHRKLKALTGQSATEFIRSIRLKRAAQMIRQRTGNISEIAYQTGFNNLSYFTRTFKEYFNCLPSEYQ